MIMFIVLLFGFIVCIPFFIIEFMILWNHDDSESKRRQEIRDRANYRNSCNSNSFNNYNDNRSYKEVNNTYNTKITNIGDYKPEKKCNYCGNAYTGLKCGNCGNGEPGGYIKNELFD
jgi:hypothetical protein